VIGGVACRCSGTILVGGERRARIFSADRASLRGAPMLVAAGLARVAPRRLVGDRDHAAALGAAFALLATAPALWFQIDRAFRMLLETDNEGWNAYFAARAMGEGGPLYPGAEALVVNNYPPLSFYLVGAFGRLCGDPVLAGRLLSLLAVGVVALLIGGLVVRLTGGRAVGACAGACFLALLAAFPGGRIGLNDPQLLAHAVMLAGLWLVWRPAPGFVALLAGALLMVAAGLIKHNLIAVPLAVTFWAVLGDGRLRRHWLAAATLALLLGVALLLLVWGWPAVEGLRAPRQVSPAKLAADARRWLALLFAPLVCWLAALALLPRERQALLVHLLVASALLEMLLSAGGAGTAANVAFDLIIALSLAVGLALGRLPAGLAAGALLPALLLHLAVVTPAEPLRVLAGAAPGKAAEEAAVREDVLLLATQPGAVLCFDAVLCWYAGQPFLLDAFNMGQHYAQGSRDPAALAARLRAREFALIEIPLARFRTPPWATVMAALEAAYRPVRESAGRTFLVPR